MKELKSGDIMSFMQEDGNRLILIVHPDGIRIKADHPGINLQIHRCSTFAVSAIATDGKL